LDIGFAVSMKYIDAYSDKLGAWFFYA